MKPVITCIIVLLLNILASSINMRFFADSIALVAGGYFISLGVLPLVMSIIIGSVGVAFLGQGLKNGLKRYWWILIVGTIAAFFPIGYVLWCMSQPGS